MESILLSLIRARFNFLKREIYALPQKTVLCKAAQAFAVLVQVEFLGDQIIMNRSDKQNKVYRLNTF